MSLDSYIARLVDQAPPLTEAQRARLAALLLPAQEDSIRRVVAELDVQRTAEEAEDRRAVDRAKRRRKDPADIALEMLGKRFDQMHKRAKDHESATADDALVRSALQIMSKLDVPFAEAFANAKGIAESRRMDEERRRTHANGHMWCVLGECPNAWGEDDE